MPTESKGARLYLRAAKGNERAVWLIRDGEKSIRTGCGPTERPEAEQKLAEYIQSKHTASRSKKQSPSEVLVADVVQIYLNDVAPNVARPAEAGARLTSILTFFGSRTLDDISGTLCRQYARKRKSLSAARRELEDLRAAINYHFSEGYCSYKTAIALPTKSPSRERWLTRSEAARLLWSAWKGKVREADAIGRRVNTSQAKRKHVARFILVGLYTGTRATAICNAAMEPTEDRGYVDLEHGHFYRKARTKVETKKRQPPVKLHPRLLCHLRRWHEKGKSRTAIVEWQGEPIGRMAKGFRNAARDAGLPDVTPHTLRHTSISWAMQNGAEKFEVAGMYGVSQQVLEDVYAHHHPDQGSTVFKAFDKRHSVRYPVRQSPDKEPK